MSKTKSTIHLAAARIVALGIQLVSVRLYLHWLGKEAYGVFLLAQVWITYLVFLDVGFGAGAGKKITEAFGRGDREEAAQIFRMEFLYDVLLGGFGFLVIVGYGVAQRTLGIGRGANPSLALTALLGLAFWSGCLIGTASMILIANDRFNKIALLNVASGVLGATLGLGLVYVFRTVESLALGLLLTNLAVLAPLYRLVRQHVPLGRGPLPVRGTIREIAQVGLRSYAHRVSTAVGRTADRFVVGTLSPAQLTAYGLASKLPDTSQDVASSVGLAIGPQLVRASGDRREFAALVERNCRLALAIGCGLILMPAAFGSSLLQVWLGDPTLKSVGSVVLLLGVYRTFEVFYGAVAAAFYADGRPHLLSAFSAFNALATAAAAYPAYRAAGLVGLGAMNAMIGLAQFVPMVLMMRRTIGPHFDARSFALRCGAIIGTSLPVAMAAHHFIDVRIADRIPWLSLILAPLLAIAWVTLLCAVRLCPTPDPIRRAAQRAVRRLGLSGAAA